MTLGKTEPPFKKLVVPIVVGTRPEAIKLVPIILALRESDHYEPIVVSTGQHNRMVDYIFELADIKPDVVLWAGSRRSSLNERVATVMRRFEDFCADRFDVDFDGRAERSTTSSTAAARPPSSSTATPARRWPPRSRPSTCGSRSSTSRPACAPAASTSPRSRRSSTGR